MKNEIIISSTGKVMNVIYSGQILIEDILDSIKARMGLDNGEAIKKIKVMIVDFTNVDSLDLSTEDIIRDADATREAARINPNITLIGVVPGTFKIDLSRMWQTYADFSDPLPWKSHVVRTIEDANTITKDIIETT